MNSFYSPEELAVLGLKSYGQNVLISRKSSIYGAMNIEIGNNVRIDDFCILSGNISIGDYVHIAAYSALYAGDAGIEIDDFANISSRVVIYAVNDDYSGESMTNPMIPGKYKIPQEEKVILHKHVIIGSGSTILPGVELKEGSAVGCMSLVKENLEMWTIYAGIPVKVIKERSRRARELEKELISMGGGKI